MLQYRRVVGLGVVDQRDRRIDQLGGVVRRDARRHADRDAARAVCQQIGEQPRKKLRLLLLAIIGWAEIGGVFVQGIH